MTINLENNIKDEYAIVNSSIISLRRVIFEKQTKLLFEEEKLLKLYDLARSYQITLPDMPPEPPPISIKYNRDKTKKHLIIKAMMEYLELYGESHRTKLLDHIKNKGINLGDRPMLYIAVMLCKQKQYFTATGKGKYRLATN